MKTSWPTVSFEPFQIVRVPFPFTDRASSMRRPALILSDDIEFNAPIGHAVMAMITSQSHAPWPLDCAITDLKSAGLPAPSVVRFKLFTLDHRLVLGVLGALAPEDTAAVRSNLHRLLASALDPPSTT